VLCLWQFLLLLLSATHWIGCAWWLAASFHGFDDTTWVYQYLDLTSEANELERTDPEDLPWQFQYTLSLFWGFQVGVDFCR
jgi:hypothetical protein